MSWVRASARRLSEDIRSEKSLERVSQPLSRSVMRPVSSHRCLIDGSKTRSRYAYQRASLKGSNTSADSRLRVGCLHHYSREHKTGLNSCSDPGRSLQPWSPKRTDFSSSPNNQDSRSSSSSTRRDFEQLRCSLSDQLVIFPSCTGLINGMLGRSVSHSRYTALVQPSRVQNTSNPPFVGSDGHKQLKPSSRFATAKISRRNTRVNSSHTTSCRNLPVRHRVLSKKYFGGPPSLLTTAIGHHTVGGSLPRRSLIHVSDRFLHFTREVETARSRSRVHTGSGRHPHNKVSLPTRSDVMALI